MKLRRILWVLLIAFVVLVAARFINRSKSGQEIQTERVIPIVSMNPSIGAIADKIALTGDIKAETEVSVRPRIAGRVEELYVEEGDFVRRGDKLLSYVAGITSSSEVYEDMVVRAPISGVVGMKLVKLGEQVTSQPGGINPVFTLYDISTVKAYVDLPEKYYSNVKRRTPVIITLDALPGKIFNGYVNNIRPVIDPMTRTAQLEIVLNNSSGIIKPGMFAKVEVILSSRGAAMIVPFDAVLGETEKYVFVNLNGVATKKTVSIGIQQDNNVEVLSGLAVSDKVITLGQRVVKEGSPVEESK